MNNKKFGNFLKELRKEQKLTQEDLAKEFVVDRGTISKWERGEYIPTSDMLLNISNYFGLTINELLAGERLNKDNKEIINKVTRDVLKEKENKSKLVKRILLIGISTILLLITLFLSYYFINNYKSISVYRLSAETNKFNIDDGLMIVSKQKVYIKIGEIQTYENDKITNIRLYYKKDNKEYEVYKNSKIEMTIVNIFGADEIFKYTDINYIKEDLYIDIEYNDYDKDTIELTVKKDFTNNKIITNNKNSNKEINTNTYQNIPRYIKDNFEYDKEENKYFRRYSKDNIRIEEYYFFDSFNYIVIEKYNDYSSHFEYSFESKELGYYIVNGKNITDNFTYDLNTKKCINNICPKEKISYFNDNYLCNFKK